MNIVVIGLGSMGKRRIRLIQEMYPDYEVTVSPDVDLTDL